MAQKMSIDTDTASDDAVALVLALRDPRVEVLGITVVVGNVEVDKGVQNELYTAEKCGVSVPVYRGADRPLMHDFEVAYNVHGQDGMGDIGLRSEEHTSELQSRGHLVCRLLLEKKKKTNN